jgi:hypothetical protein
MVTAKKVEGESYCAIVVLYCPCAGKRALKRVTPILGGFCKDDYTTERLWAKAKDGTEVRMPYYSRSCHN